MRRSGLREATATEFTPRIPLVVIGALRAGGSGKTSVTAELARRLMERGDRVAIMAYRLGRGRAGADADAQEVQEAREDDDWRLFSEETLMLRRGTGARVFAVRNRARAWRALHDPALHAGRPFDIILSDDGFQDPRLDGAFKMLLMAPDEHPRWTDVLPAGQFRETAAARLRADLILRGPMDDHKKGSIDAGARAHQASNEKRSAAGVSAAAGARFARGPALPPERSFRCELMLPPHVAGLGDAGEIAASALGDNEAFARGLRAAGVRVVATVRARDHAVLSERRLEAVAARFPGAGILCTRKDILKLDAEFCARRRVRAVDRKVILDPDVLAAVDAYRLRFQDGILVH